MSSVPDPLTLTWVVAAAATVAVWALLIGPRILQSASLGTPLLAKMVIWGVLALPAVANVIDPEYFRGASETQLTGGLWVLRAGSALIWIALSAAVVDSLSPGSNRGHRWLLILIAYHIVVIVSAVYNDRFSDTVLLAPAALFALTKLRSTPQAVRHLHLVLRGVSLGSLLFLLIDYDGATRSGREVLGIDQLAGVTAHPNALGSLAALLLALELFKSRASTSRIWISICFATLVLSGSRGAWLAATVILFMRVRDRFGRPPAALALAGAALSAWILFTEGTRLTGRDKAWQVAWDLFVDHPVIGAGPGGLAEASREMSMEWAGQAHNQVLDSLAKTGLAGTAILLIALGTMWLAARSSQSARARSVLLGLFALAVVESPFSGLSLTIPLVLILSSDVIATVAGRAITSETADSVVDETAVDLPGHQKE